MTLELWLIIAETLAIIVLASLYVSASRSVSFLESEMRWRSQNYESWEKDQRLKNVHWNSRRDRIEKAAARAIALLRTAIERNKDKPCK